MTAIGIRYLRTQWLVLCIAVALLVVITFSPSFISMWKLWGTIDHRHGLLVFPISLFLLWQIRGRLAALTITADAKGLLFLVPLAAIWLLSRLAGIQVIEHLCVLAMIPAAIATVAGLPFARAAMFPLLFLMLATPVGESLVPFLMSITADLAAVLLKLSGIPLFRNGQYMSLPGGEFVVADVCSGLRYLLTGSMIALLFGYLMYSSLIKRLVFLALTVVTLIVANGVRAYIVMAVASGTNMQYLGGQDHVYFGWLLFGAVMMMIMWFGAGYADADDSFVGAAGEQESSESRLGSLPIIAALGIVMLAVTIKPLQADFGENSMLFAAIFSAVLLAVVLFSARELKASSSNKNGSVSLAFEFISWRTLVLFIAAFVLVVVPRFAVSVERNASKAVYDLDFEAIVPCSVVGEWQSIWKPQFFFADTERAVALSCSGLEVNLFAAGYSSALQGSELVNSMHVIVPPEWDRFVTRSGRELSDRNGQSRSILEIQLAAPDSNFLIWFWYQVDNTVTANTFITKVNQIRALLARRPAGGRAVVLETRITADVEQARKRIAPIATAIMGSESYLPFKDRD